MESETGRRLLERLREFRKKLDLTQEAFAERMGMDYKYYQQLEGGRKKDFRISTLDKLAAGMGVEPWELLHPELAVSAVEEAQVKYGPKRRPRRKRRSS